MQRARELGLIHLFSREKVLVADGQPPSGPIQRRLSVCRKRDCTCRCQRVAACCSVLQQKPGRRPEEGLQRSAAVCSGFQRTPAHSSGLRQRSQGTFGDSSTLLDSGSWARHQPFRWPHTPCTSAGIPPSTPPQAVRLKPHPFPGRRRWQGLCAQPTQHPSCQSRPRPPTAWWQRTTPAGIFCAVCPPPHAALCHLFPIQSSASRAPWQFVRGT